MTTQEAENIIAMLKKMVERYLMLPESGEKKDYKIETLDNKYEFVLNVSRTSRIKEKKCTYIVRTKDTGINLLRLDVNGPPHKNPDHTIIDCPHLHVFKEEFEDRNLPYAIPFEVDSEDLSEACIKFLKKFNVIDIPTMTEQNRLFN